MTTKEQYAEQCRDENPEMHVTENGVTRKLSQAEYDEAVEAWATMMFEQQTEAEALKAQAVAKQAVINRLGLTEQEAQLLLGS
jgi:hypothetical protein